MKSSVSSNPHIILLFIDGVGIGENNPDFNPCAYSELGIFNHNNERLPFGGNKYRLDACLGVKGFPQSGSGQTTIYTGVNAPKTIGHHLFGFPNQKLRDVIQKSSIFVTLTAMGYRCKFINAFRPVFITTPEIFSNMRMSATTEMNRAAGLPFSQLKDIRTKHALYHDYTNGVISHLGFGLPHYSAADASEIILAQSARHDLVLYEYFLTDTAGHSRDMDRAVEQIHRVEQLIHAVAGGLNKKNTVLLVVSDHGNIEDLRSKSHTLNPAFMALWGNDSIKDSFKSLTDIKPFVMNTITAANKVKNS